MMLSEQRCFHHRSREAVALCPECRRYFCRECITEHDDRVVCAECLERLAGRGTMPRSKGRRALSSITGAMLGVLVTWLLFYTVGQLLIRIPTPFHEGQIWEELP